MSEGSWEKLSQVAVKGAEHDSRERQPHPKCLEGTRVVLLNYIYELLDNKEKSRIIWLHGTASVGKSAVAFTAAERMRCLKVTEGSKEKRLGGTFFFSRKHTKRRTTGHFFVTLAYQLASNFPSVREEVNSAILENPALLDPDKSLRDQMEALFLRPLRRLRFRLRGCPPLAFVIDALDECTPESLESESLDESTSEGELADLISLLGEALREPDLPVTHILLTSRSEEHIRKAMQREEMHMLVCEIPAKTSGESVTATISLDGADVDHDIYIFLQHSFRDLESRDPDFPQPSEDQFARLASRAGRRFIVASTMMMFIDDRNHDPRDRLQLMLELTSELLPGTEVYKLYDRILSTCVDPSLAYLHLSVVSALADPLPMSQISKLLGPSQGRDVERVLVQLRSIVDVPSDSSLPVNIYHSSVRDYVSHRSNCNLRQVKNITSPHSLLALSSLRLMIREIPESTALLYALSGLTKHSQAMESHDPQNLTQSLSFTVEPPEPMQVLITLLWLRGNRSPELQFWLETPDGYAWLQTEGVEDWLEIQGGQDWLKTSGGRSWLHTCRGENWLQTCVGRGWLQTEGGRDWLQTVQGVKWLGSSAGKDWMITVYGFTELETLWRAWLEIEGGEGWLQTPRGDTWLANSAGNHWLQTSDGGEWLETLGGTDWLRTLGGTDWLRTPGGTDWLHRGEWLQTPDGAEWLQTPGGTSWLQTLGGTDWLQTSAGSDWLRTSGATDWLQTPGGQRWLCIKKARGWLEFRSWRRWPQMPPSRLPLIPSIPPPVAPPALTPVLQPPLSLSCLMPPVQSSSLPTADEEYLQSPDGKTWLQTMGGMEWLQTLGSRDWLQTRGGRDWLQFWSGRQWLQNESGSDWLQSPDGKNWLQTQGGSDWLPTEGGRNWLKSEGERDWLQTLSGRYWLQTQGGRDWLQTQSGRDWLQTQGGRDWLQTPHGQAWRLTTVWVTMEDFSSTLEAIREYKVFLELPSQPIFQAIQQFRSLPDFLIFPAFLALKHMDCSTSALPQGRFSPDLEVIHAIIAFSNFTYEARTRSRSASDALSYACQHWAIHLSRAPNPWDETLTHTFMSFWNRRLLSWFERQWCLKDLQSCLFILSDGQKLAKEHLLQAPGLS